MGRWLERHREAVQVAAAVSLGFSIAWGAWSMKVRRPQEAAIVIQAITPLPTASSASTSTPGPIKVYVSGAVAYPGVYSLPWDSRVEQAIAAGHASSEADLARVNLAERIYDGQQIYVPSKAETATPVLPTAVPSPQTAAQPSSPGQKININVANTTELETLPGIGPVLAQRIIDYRQVHGPFAQPEDIKNVSGIGDATFMRIQDMIIIE